MIEGVKIKKVVSHQDDRGFFAELVKSGEETFLNIQQTSYTETYPGVIKAFHWHKKQDDVWFVFKGNARVVLYDVRKDSPTHGQTDVHYAGESNKIVIFIPVGVAHGYQVLGTTPVGLFYHTTQPYNPKDPDEQRIAFDDKTINFDWSIKNR